MTTDEKIKAAKDYYRDSRDFFRQRRDRLEALLLEEADLAREFDEIRLRGSEFAASVTVKCQQGLTDEALKALVLIEARKDPNATADFERAKKINDRRNLIAVDIQVLMYETQNAWAFNGE